MIDQDQETSQRMLLSASRAPRAYALVAMSGPVPGRIYTIPRPGLTVSRNCEAAVGPPDWQSNLDLLWFSVQADRLGVRGLNGHSSVNVNGHTRPQATLSPGDLVSFGEAVYRVIEGSEEIGFYSAMIDLAFRDPLTNLNNRYYFQQCLEREVRRSLGCGMPLCAFFADMDAFAEVNRHFGRDTGDAVLAQVGAVLSTPLSWWDHLCRFGGDEFVAILPGTELHRAEALAEASRRSVAEQRFETKAGVVRVTVSIGVAQLDPDQSHELIAAADQAQYVAKYRGRNQVAVAGSRDADSADARGVAEHLLQHAAASRAL